MDILINWFIAHGESRETAKRTANMFYGEMWAIAEDTEIDPDAQYEELIHLCECYGVPEDVMYSAM